MSDLGRFFDWSTYRRLTAPGAPLPDEEIETVDVGRLEGTVGMRVIEVYTTHYPHVFCPRTDRHRLDECGIPAPKTAERWDGPVNREA